MRKPSFVKSCSIGLVAIVAACSSPTVENAAADNAAANAVVAPEADNGADANAAAPDAGNAAGAAAAAGEGEAYRASGSEPFWSMVIDDRIMFDSADGPDINVATPPQQPTRAGYRYVTPEITVVVNEFNRCTAASGEVHHDTVQVMVGGQNFSGCGGAVMPPAQ